LIDVLPFIKTEFISSVETQHKIERALTIQATIVFTSVNAVEAVAQKINDKKLNPIAIRWKIFCIGYATKQSVVKNFGEKSIAGVADNAKDLAKTIIDANISEVIFFCGDQRRDELPGLLKKNKIGVKEIVVYKTIATPKKIEKKYDGILFFSPSAVKSFFQENKKDEQVMLFAIGNTTADEIRKFSKNKIVVSDVPDKKTLLNNVISYFQMNPIHH
jgi:uroporphyrinogen-III synthase